MTCFMIVLCNFKRIYRENNQMQKKVYFQRITINNRLSNKSELNKTSKIIPKTIGNFFQIKLHGFSFFFFSSLSLLRWKKKKYAEYLIDRANNNETSEKNHEMSYEEKKLLFGCIECNPSMILHSCQCATVRELLLRWSHRETCLRQTKQSI